MIISIKDQLSLIFFSIAAGILTGVLFDSYRLIRGFRNPNKFITIIEDILFWIFTAVFVFAFLLYTHSTYLSVYVYICILLGVYIYIKLISNFFLFTEGILIKNMLKCIRIVINALIFPFKLVIYGRSKKK